MSSWGRLAIACITYVLANVFDCIMTVEGITTGRHQEGNPIVQYYINYFGLEHGLLFYKSLMCILIILAAIILDFAYNKKARSSRPLRLPLYLLYFGAFATLLGGLSWW
jgi:hypothetical protein